MTLKNLTLLFPIASNKYNLDIIGELLMNYGALSVSFEDANKGTEKEIPIFREPVAGEVHWNPSSTSGERFWQFVQVKALFSAQADVESVMLDLAGDLDLPVEPRFKVENLEDEDWVRRVQDTFKPIHFGRVLITFPWRKEEPPKDKIPIILEPGAAFGTGEHATTRLCIQWLEKNIQSQDELSVLDYGCGSGILSIVAKKVGAKMVVGVEIDPDAVQVARRNLPVNGIHDDSISYFLPGEDPANVQYDLSVANILANPLCDLAPTIARKTKPGGKLALSGILAHQAEYVMQVYEENGFSMSEGSVDNGWILLRGSKI
mmetsp:Transcript_131/g.393  ORF Transcript_131/g.393 Transcript_131/m.393 type:complete len:318 (+) Transcript_131:70-1023(+)